MIKTEYVLLTNPGGREINEDSVAVEASGAGLVAMAADGLGSHGGGQQASRAATEEIAACFREGQCKNEEEIAIAISRANGAVLACQTEGCAMKTTLAALFIGEGQAIWAHVGDTRIYYFRDARLVSRTMDHSVPQLAVSMGMITEDQIRFHEDRNRILRALGSDSPEPDISSPCPLGDGFHAFLLCTDGFWEYVLEQEMEEALAASSNPGQWLERMEAALKGRAPEGQDNYSAAAVFAIEEK